MNGIGGLGLGGPAVMLLLVALTGVLCLGITIPTGRRIGWHRAVPLGLLLWSLACLAVITLVPTSAAAPVIRFTEVCSFDYGGPAPEGFWILPGGQRLLNTVVFVPSGVLLAWTLTRFRHGGWWLLPGAIALMAWSVGIELTQQRVSRLGRACDITDMVDNAIGSVIGMMIGLLAAGVWALLRRVSRRSAR